MSGWRDDVMEGLALLFMVMALSVVALAMLVRL